MVAASNELQPPVVLWDKRLVAVAGLGIVVLAVEVWALFANASGVLFVLGAASMLVLLLLPIVITYRTVQFTLQAIKSATTVQPVQAYARAALRRSTFLMILEAVLAIPLFVIFNLYFQLTVIAALISYPVYVYTLMSSVMQHAVFALITAIGLWGINPLACALGTSFAIESRHAVLAILVALVIVIVLAVFPIYLLLSNLDFLVIPAALLPFVLAGVVKSL